MFSNRMQNTVGIISLNQNISAAFLRSAVKTDISAQRLPSRHRYIAAEDVVSPNRICRRSNRHEITNQGLTWGGETEPGQINLQEIRRPPLADWPRLTWLEESPALFRKWEVGRSWRWRAWLALWPSDPENRRKKRERL